MPDARCHALVDPSGEVRNQRTAFSAPSVVGQPFELLGDVEDVPDDWKSFGTGRKGSSPLIERDDCDDSESRDKSRKPGIEGHGHCGEVGRTDDLHSVFLGLFIRSGGLFHVYSFITHIRDNYSRTSNDSTLATGTWFSWRMFTRRYGPNRWVRTRGL